VFTWELISRSFLVGNVARPCQEWPQKIIHTGMPLRFLHTCLIWRNCICSLHTLHFAWYKKIWDRIRGQFSWLQNVFSVALTNIIISLPALISRFLPVKVKVNHLTPNGHYMGRTVQLTSRCCILYIYSTNIRIEYFKHAA